MSELHRLVTAVGGSRLVYAFGGLYVALALGKVVAVVTSGGTLAAAVVDFVLVGGPGLVLLYGAYWSRRTGLPSDRYPRLLGWCLAGFGAMVVVVELINYEPGVVIAHLFWTAALATAMGTATGFVVGAYDARSIVHAREVRQVNRQLETANEELERQNDRLESFASMLAHELRNPLNIAQIYLNQAVEGDRDAVDEVEAAHDRIGEIVEVLLVTARKSQSAIDTEVVSLADVAASAWEDLRVERAELVVETDRTVRSNAVHLQHLFENLFKNAVEHGSTSQQAEPADAVEHGSTSNRPSADDAIEHGNVDVTVRVGDLPDGFYVEDDGPGIPEDDRDTVFEAGYTTDVDGIGFGLAFVSRVAELYGWDCSVTEAETGGARFEFTGVDRVASKEIQSTEQV